MRPNRRLSSLPGYPFAGAAEEKKRLVEAGVDVIDLGAGDADLPPPPEVVSALQRAAEDARFSRYGFQLGLPEFRESVAAWMERRFGVTVDPYEEVLPLIGSKEGLAKLPLGVLDPGDAAVMPDPGYQAYRGGVVLAGGEAVQIPLRPEHDFLLPFDAVPGGAAGRTRLLYLNYPNNPTAAAAPDAYYADAIAWCAERQAVLAHDHAYSEIAFDGYRPRSILEFDGARDVAVEFHSLSKTYNMTGWRLGWAVGNRHIIGLLSRVKTFMDTGAFLAVQAAGVAALGCWERWVPGNVEIFRRRRDRAVSAFRDAGFDAVRPKATMYLWIPVPEGESSQDFCRRALREAGVFILAGAALGPGGEGFFRVALTVGEDRLAEAAARLAALV